MNKPVFHHFGDLKITKTIHSLQQIDLIHFLFLVIHDDPNEVLSFGWRDKWRDKCGVINRTDLDILFKRGALPDTIIFFYLTYLWSFLNKRDDVYLFDTMAYTCLETSEKKVANWTKYNIWSKRLLVFPIHLSDGGGHWILIIVWLPAAPTQFVAVHAIV